MAGILITTRYRDKTAHRSPAPILIVYHQLTMLSYPTDEVYKTAMYYYSRMLVITTELRNKFDARHIRVRVSGCAVIKVSYLVPQWNMIRIPECHA